MATTNNSNPLIIVIILAVVAVIAYYLLTMPDQRNGAEKIGDAITELPNGVDKAARQLEDRSPGEKLGDAVKDTGDEIKENTNR